MLSAIFMVFVVFISRFYFRESFFSKKMKLNSVWVGSLLFLFAISALGNSKYNKFDSSLYIGLQVKGSYQLFKRLTLTYQMVDNTSRAVTLYR